MYLRIRDFVIHPMHNHSLRLRDKADRGKLYEEIRLVQVTANNVNDKRSNIRHQLSLNIAILVTTNPVIEYFGKNVKTVRH